MTLFKKEKNILNIIKYGAISLIVILSFTLTQIFINQKEKDLSLNITQLEREYITHNKAVVKNLVNRIHGFIEVEKKKELSDLRNKIKEEVYNAHSIATAIYNKNKNKSNYSKQKTLEEIKNSLGAIRFNNDRGYIFIDTEDGRKILHPIKNIEGKNLLEHKDANGYQFVKKIVQTIKNKTETFDEYYWYKGTDEGKSFKKIGFYKYFEPFNLAIGSGDYVKDFERSLKKEILFKINSLKFEKPRHLFIYDLKGLCLVNPKKELIGVNRYNSQRKDGTYGLRETLEYVKLNKEGFIRYNSSVILNTTLQSHDKISFLKLFEDWGWMIGSGFHLEELEQSIQLKIDNLEKSNDETISKIVLTSIIITVFIILFSFYISSKISQIFNDYKKDLESEITDKLQKEKLLIQQSKMASMGEMIGSIAHQWKQPLSVISMSNGLLRMSFEEKGIITEKAQLKSVESIDHSIKHLTQTIDDFRNFFNPNKERTLFKIQTAFEETFKLISSQLQNSDIKVIENIEDIELFGSQNELEQTLINLLKNAKEELAKTIKDKKKYIFVEAYKQDNQIVIKIKDNANGIPNEIINTIFDAYFTTKENTGGSGIGLYMSKQIIEQSMHGQISVSNKEYTYDNEEYKGAEFLIMIPIDLRI